jgi:hypothetical protein
MFAIIITGYQDFPLIAKIMVKLFFTSLFIFAPLSLFLFALHHDQKIKFNLIIILLPLFVAQIIALLFLCFLMPALMDQNTRLYAYLLNSYYIAIWLSELIFVLIVRSFFIIFN